MYRHHCDSILIFSIRERHRIEMHLHELARMRALLLCDIVCCVYFVLYVCAYVYVYVGLFWVLIVYVCVYKIMLVFYDSVAINKRMVKGGDGCS